MTSKDYAVIARAINDTRIDYARGSCDGDFADSMERARGVGSHLALRRLALTLADELAKDNPAFDRARFHKACGFDI